MIGRVIFAAALSVSTGFGTPYDDHWPPVRWRGVGETAVIFARTQAEIDELCGMAPHGLTTEACTTDSGIEVLPDPCAFAGEYARIGCHENAHRFKGWPGSHPL